MYSVKVAQVLLKSSKVWLRYKKHKYTKQINHKLQANARGCKENKNEIWLKYFALKDRFWKPVEEQWCYRLKRIWLQGFFTA